MKASHVQWCRDLFDRMADGGIWGLPSHGLIFRKDGSELVLIDIMPHMEEMPITAAELKQNQEEIFLQTQQHFEAAGINVRRMQ